MRPAKIYETDSGFWFSVGFNPITREFDRHRVFWNDPSTKKWEASVANMAGDIQFPFEIRPEFVRDLGNLIVMYQGGICIEFQQTVAPLIWEAKVMRAEG